jgi:hypothetical protein
MKTFLLCFLFLLFSGGIVAMQLIQRMLEPLIFKTDLRNPIKSNYYKHGTSESKFGNIVQIRQIGNYNNVQANLTANNIELDITQKGDKNQIYL